MKIEKRIDADLVWLGEVERPKKALIFSHQEPSPLSYVIGRAICEHEDSEKIGFLLSKMQRIPPILSADDKVGWEFYQQGDCLFVCVGAFQPLSRLNSNHWLFGYPMLRELTLTLADAGVEEIMCMSSTLYEDLFNEEVNLTREAGVIETDLESYGGSVPLFCWVPQKLFGGENKLLLIEIPVGDFLDRDAMEQTISWFEERGYSLDMEFVEKTYTKFSEEGFGDEILTQIMAEMEGPNEVMFS